MFQDESEAETRTGVVGLESSKLVLDGLQPYTTYRLTLHTACSATVRASQASKAPT